MSLILEDVLVEGDMFAKIPLLKMEDWDLADQEKFPELSPSMYLENIPYDDGMVRVEPKSWALGLQKSRLLNLLHIPHFGCSTINDICLHQLLNLVHYNCVWLVVLIQLMLR